eukprot:g16369.t1
MMQMELVHACTSVAVGPNATELGNTMVSHTVDCSSCDSRVTYVKPRRWSDGKRPIRYQAMDYPRYIPADPLHTTYGYYDGAYGLLNDQGLAFGESTCGAKLFQTARSPTENPSGPLFGLKPLTQVALERCATARCAIKTMGDLAVAYGFYGEDPGPPGAGESLQIGDGREAWVFHVLSDGEKSAVWAAKKVPDDSLAVVANGFIIRDVTDCAMGRGKQDRISSSSDVLCSENLVQVAEKNGLWTRNEQLQKKNPIFDFTEVFGEDVMKFHYIQEFPPIPLYMTARMWRMFSFVNPSSMPEMPPEDQRLDHYEGTGLDMRKGIVAGPFGSPNRLERGKAVIERAVQFPRAISIPRTTYAWVGSSFARKTDFGNGKMTSSRGFFAPDTPATTVFFPLLLPTAAAGDSDSAIIQLGESLQRGNKWKVDRKSAWWAFDFVANLMEWNYQTMEAQDVRPRIQKWEKKVEEFLEESQSSQESASTPATRRWNKQAALHDAISADWWALSDELIVKYNDGFINTKRTGLGSFGGYSGGYLDAVGANSVPNPKYVQPVPETVVSTYGDYVASVEDENDGGKAKKTKSSGESNLMSSIKSSTLLSESENDDQKQKKGQSAPTAGAGAVAVDEEKLDPLSTGLLGAVVGALLTFLITGRLRGRTLQPSDGVYHAI